MNLLESKTDKLLALVLVLLILLPVAEILRERAGYHSYSQRLESAYKELKPGTDRQQVIERLGNPDFALRQTWNWHAGQHQGWLREKLPGSTVKGHYTLAIEFDQQNKIVHTWGGIN